MLYQTPPDDWVANNWCRKSMHLWIWFFRPTWFHSPHERGRTHDISVWLVAALSIAVLRILLERQNNKDRHGPAAVYDWWGHRCPLECVPTSPGTVHLAARWMPICRIPVAKAFRRFSIRTVRLNCLPNKCNWWGIAEHFRLERRPQEILLNCPTLVFRPILMSLKSGKRVRMIAMTQFNIITTNLCVIGGRLLMHSSTFETDGWMYDRSSARGYQR